MTWLTRPLKIKTTFNHRSTLQNSAGFYTTVLNIHLADCKGQPPTGSTARIVYEHLNSLTRGIVSYIKMPFDFGTLEDIQNYAYGVGKLVEALESRDLSWYVLRPAIILDQLTCSALVASSYSSLFHPYPTPRCCNTPPKRTRLPQMTS